MSWTECSTRITLLFRLLAESVVTVFTCIFLLQINAHHKISLQNQNWSLFCCNNNKCLFIDVCTLLLYLSISLASLIVFFLSQYKSATEDPVYTHTLMQTNWEKKGWVEIFAYDQRVFHRQISKFYLRHWWWRWWCQPWISLCSPRSHIAQNFRVKYSHCLPAHAYQMKLNTPREWVRVFVRCCCFFFHSTLQITLTTAKATRKTNELSEINAKFRCKIDEIRVCVAWVRLIAFAHLCLPNLCALLCVNIKENSQERGSLHAGRYRCCFFRNSCYCCCYDEGMLLHRRITHTHTHANSVGRMRVGRTGIAEIKNEQKNKKMKKTKK